MNRHKAPDLGQDPSINQLCDSEEDVVIMEPDFKVYDIEEAINVAGGFGKFQWIFCIITALLFMPSGFIVFNQSFFTLKQVMKCPGPAGDLVLCEEAEIDPCNKDTLISGAVPDFTNERSLRNWIIELDLFCVESYKISLFGTIYWTGLLLGMIILAYTSRFGRRTNLIASSWGILFVTASIVFISNIYARYIGMFLLGICTIQKYSAYIICVEIVPFKNQIIVASCVLALNTTTFPFSSMFFRFISNDWRIIGYIFLTFTFLSAIASLFVPESPRFLADNGDYDKARALINRIAFINGSNQYMGHCKFIDEIKESNNSLPSRDNYNINNPLCEEGNEDVNISRPKAHKNPINQILRHPRLGLNLLISTMCWTACSFNYYLLGYDIKNLGGNIFLNTSLIAFAGMGGKLLTIFVRKHVSTRISMMGCFTVCFVFGLGLVFVEQGWLVTICIAFILMGLGGGFSLAYFLNNEYFTPLFVGFAFSVTQFGSRGMTTLSYLMSDLKAPIPMILFCIITGLALLSLFFLNKPPRDSK